MPIRLVTIGHRDHQRHETVEQREIGTRLAGARARWVSEQRVVEDRRRSASGLTHAEARRDGDRDADEPDRAPVRPEGVDHPSHGGPIDRSLIRVDGRHGEESSVATHVSEDTSRGDDYSRPPDVPDDAARAITASIIGAVSFPVKVFCCDGWKHPSSV